MAAVVIVCDSTAEYEGWKLQALGLLCIAYDLKRLLFVDRAKDGKPIEDVGMHAPGFKAVRCKSLPEALERCEHRERASTVFVEGPTAHPNARSLWTFRHDPECVYVFGSDRSTGLWPTYSKAPGSWLYIPGRRGVMGYLAAASVLSHRFGSMQR